MSAQPSPLATSLSAALAEHARGGRRYRELLRAPAMSVGIYRLEAGAEDPQQPHAEDELYQVLGGRAALVVGDQRLPVEPGGLLFVPARAPHRFVDIEEDLTVLVLFTPAEGSIPDADLGALSREQLVAEVMRLRGGIRAHRDATEHELCWHHPALWGLLPEKTDPQPRVPDWPQFIRGCVRYRQSLDEQLPRAPRSRDEHDG
jgi:mannose-6-phosphate isomerase-like protein (cupin superfamily)